MALVTHQVQGSYAHSRALSLQRDIGSKQFLAHFPTVKRTDIILLKRRSCLCLPAPIRGSKWNPLRVSSFKGNVQNDDSGGRASGSKSIKNSVKLSYVSQQSEENLSESQKMQNIHASSTSVADETTEKSLAIRELFRSWLTLLRTPSPNQVVDESVETLEEPISNETLEIERRLHTRREVDILKVVWSRLLGIDVKIMIPALIFAPMYLAVNMKYGAEVAKELTPLWIVGPLFAALYVKMLQGILSVYVFSFKTLAKVVKNIPTYYLVAHDYVASGKLRDRLWQPIVDLRNLDYKEVAETKWKDYKERLMEQYLDFVESIWPYYCKIIRFLKRAHFI